MPATRTKSWRGVGRLQVSRNKSEERLEGILFFLAGTHGEKSGGDDHTEKNQSENEIVDHGECSLARLYTVCWSHHRTIGAFAT